VDFVFLFPGLLWNFTCLLRREGGQDAGRCKLANLIFAAMAEVFRW